MQGTRLSVCDLLSPSALNRELQRPMHVWCRTNTAARFLPASCCQAFAVHDYHAVSPCSLQGILYEDTYMQVGLQSRYTRSTGELLLFLGNKQSSQALTGLVLLLSAPSPAVQVVVGQLPQHLAPKQQVQVSSTVTRATQPSTSCRPFVGLEKNERTASGSTVKYVCISNVLPIGSWCAT